jgi:competence protein ComEC
VETWPQPAGSIARGVSGLQSHPRWLPWKLRLQRWVQAESGAGRLLPWIAIAYGIGIAIYFAADHEPLAWVAATVAAGLCGLCIVFRHHAAFYVLIIIAAIATGFATAALKTSRISHPVLTRPTAGTALTGFVETHEERDRTDRFVLRVETMDELRNQPKLNRVRLSIKKGTGPAVGSFVELKARLSPPLSPLRPGSYDFARDMYFQGIGASGFVTGAIKSSDAPSDGGPWLRYAAGLQNMRDAIDARIRSVLTGDARAIATALLTGRRDAITTPVNDAMFISGLGHVLSISGYHMAVVAGVVFFIVRALLAMIPAFTATFPIKKIAAFAALFASAFYLLLSGSEVATQRSFLMTSVVLIAVIVDRRAVTFRTLAIAAIAVLVIAPEALVHPSFQMSFVATLGLVALVANGMPTFFAKPDNSKVARAALWGGREFIALTLASFIAGLATTPYAAFHFHRITPYGVLANLGAMPIVSAVVMPAGLLGLIAMPFGLDGFFWQLMDFGIKWMIIVSEWVAALPGAIGRMPAFGTGPLAAATLGIIVLALLRSPLRWSGGVLIAASIAWAFAAPAPDVLVSSDGHHVGVRGKDGKLHIMQTTKDAFLVKEWLAADADPRSVTDPSIGDSVSCDEAGCVAEMRDGGLITMNLRPDGFVDDCNKAALIVSRAPPPTGCNAFSISHDKIRRFGSLTLRRDAGVFVVAAQKPGGVDRPWSPALLEEGQGGTLARRTNDRAPDATPAESDLQSGD